MTIPLEWLLIGGGLTLAGGGLPAVDKRDEFLEQGDQVGGRFVKA